MGSEARKHPLRRGWARLTFTALLTAALAVPALQAGPGGRVELRPVAGDTEAPGESTPLRVVQANINKDMKLAKVERDVAAVFAQGPDIITFNEVHNRPDQLLAPPGYEIFRTPGPRTGWAPVVWDATTWQAIDQGTVQISNRPKKIKNGMVGVRYANWVTLVNAQQQVVSVVSTHIAPNNKDTAELLVPSLVVLQELAAQLSANGPVIIGGDFNMGYRSTRYQPSYLQAVGLQSTFDLLGSAFATHRKGGIIDYLFIGPADQLSVTQHHPVTLESDHRALVADLQLAPGESTPEVELPSFQPGKIVVPRTATKKERRAIRKFQMQAIRATPPGAAIHVASNEIQGPRVYKALRKAYEDGVHVTVLAGEKKLSPQAAELRAVLGRDVHTSSWFRRKPKAWRATAPMQVGGAKVSPLQPTIFLVSKAGATPALSMVANASMGKEPLTRRYRKRAKATIMVGLNNYDALYRAYLAHVGRTY